jgi:hypothetical protein
LPLIPLGNLRKEDCGQPRFHSECLKKPKPNKKPQNNKSIEDGSLALEKAGKISLRRGYLKMIRINEQKLAIK